MLRIGGNQHFTAAMRNMTLPRKLIFGQLLWPAGKNMHVRELKR